jgi:hypothetical protein
MDVKDMSRISRKWVERASVAGADYQAGTSSPRRSWAQAAAAAESNYKDGVTRAAAAGRFGKGVGKAGDAKFQRGVTEKGVARYPAGVAAASNDFSAGFEPFRAALQSTTLQPRKARRDPSNLQRVAQVVQAMIKTAEAQGR